MQTIDFIQTQWNQLWQMIGQGYNARADKYTPYNRAKLSWDSYDLINNNTADIKAAINLWRSNVGDNGWKIHCSKSGMAKKNEKMASDVQDLLKKNNINKLISTYVNFVGRYGNAVAMINDEQKVVIKPFKQFNLYYDSINERPIRYAMLINGVEQKGELGQLQNGENIWHFIDPASEGDPMGTPRIDACYEQLLAFLHIWQANNHKWASGLIDPQLIIIDPEYKEYFETKDADGKSNWDIWRDKIKDWFGGSKKAGEAIFLPGVKDIRNPAGNAKDMLGDIFLEKAREIIATAFDLAPEDLGFGHKTHNSVANYNYALGDKVGKPLENQFAQMVNEWWLPKVLGIETDDSLFFEFNLPKDQDEREDRKVIVDAYVRSTQAGKPIFTINEVREKFGFDDAPAELLTASTQPNLPADPIMPEVKNTVKKKFSFVEKVKFSQFDNPLAKALDSQFYSRTEIDQSGNEVKKGFLPKLEKAISQQLNKCASNISEISLNEFTIDDVFPKLETFYSFNTLKKDLFNFAKFGVEDYKKTSKKVANYDFPPIITNIIDAKTQLLLQGVDSLTEDQLKVIPDSMKEYKGLDAETSAQVNTIIKNNIGSGIDAVVEALTLAIPKMAANRAMLIAHTEVAYAVEESRYQLYKEDGYLFERWLNVDDEGVCPICDDRGSQGVVPIGTFGYPAHPQDRCSKVYGKTKEDIS